MDREQYQKKYGKGPFVTVDGVVVCHAAADDYILMIKRGDNSLFALPGGFVEPDETLMAAAEREIKEETTFDLKFIQKVVDVECIPIPPFTDVDRDPRARMITFPFLFRFFSDTLPIVSGKDDATAAMWLDGDQIDQIDNNGLFYADHYQIINQALEVAKYYQILNNS